jgi:hypothetical protein
MKNLIFFVILCLAAACASDDSGKETRMRISHYQQPVFFMGPYFNYVVQEERLIGSDTWDAYGAVDGFTYEWGYTYDIIVKKEKIKNPPADGSSIKTTLVNIVSKNKVPEQTLFEIKLTWVYGNQGGFESYVRGDLASGLSLIGIPIDCGDLCETLSQGIANKKLLTGVFQHHQNGLKLIDLKVE